VAKFIKQVEKASTDYQYALLELHALQSTLERLQQLEPCSPRHVSHVNALRSMALGITIPLEEFLQKMEKFESTMGPYSRTRGISVLTLARKSQYIVVFSKEVSNLRSLVAGKVISINMLLNMQILCVTLLRADRANT
jgi:hypothetical protein